MAGVPRQNSREPKFQYGMKILLVLPVLVAVLGAVGVWFGWGIVLLLMPILIGVVVARHTKASATGTFAMVAFFYVLVALIAPNFREIRTPPSRPRCPSNLKQIIAVYNCPSAPGTPSTDTSYMLVTGEGSAWWEDWAPDIPDFPDGTSNSIAVVEMENSGIHWMEPRNLDIAQALRGVNAPAGLCIRSRHPGGASVAMVDGSVRFLPDEISAKSLDATLTAAGGDAAGGDW